MVRDGSNQRGTLVIRFNSIAYRISRSADQQNTHRCFVSSARAKICFHCDGRWLAVGVVRGVCIKEPLSHVVPLSTLRLPPPPPPLLLLLLFLLFFTFSIPSTFQRSTFIDSLILRQLIVI